MDVVNVLYPDTDHVIYYDHSLGHTAKRKNGLDASKLNKGYGGKQPSMRDSAIVSEGSLGLFSGTLCVGDVATHQFTEDDDGPCYLKEAARLEMK